MLRSPLLLLLLLLTLISVGECKWHARRLADDQCTNIGPLYCHTGGFQNSKLQGQYNRYHMRFDMTSGKGATPDSTGRFSLGLHSNNPAREALLLHMLDNVTQQCTDKKYCTLQTWWGNHSPRLHVVRDVARMQYELTPVGQPFPFYDMSYNESVTLTQLYGAFWWNQTVASAYAGYTSVDDLVDCDQPIEVKPYVDPDRTIEFGEACTALQSSDPPNYNVSMPLPFLATGLLPLQCSRVPLPQLLLTDLLSDIGAHDLRTAYDLLEQYLGGGGLPGTVGFLRPNVQLTDVWQKYGAAWQFLEKMHQQHRATAIPPCSSGPNPTTLLLAHYYKVGPRCQLYRVAQNPGWVVRLNMTVTFSANQTRPSFAQPVPESGPDGDWHVQMSWWVTWDGTSVSIQPESDYGQNPVTNLLRHFFSVNLARVIQLDDSKHRWTGPPLNGYVVACGSQLDSAQGVAQNIWEQPPWGPKPNDGWFFPVPSPGFLRTGWTNNQWNNATQAALLSAFRPGAFYWVDPQAALTEFGPACGQVGAVGPCTNGYSYSTDNAYGPMRAFSSLSEYSRNATQYADYPFSTLRYRTPYLPPLAAVWGEDFRPRGWLAGHSAANIPLSLMVEPSENLLAESLVSEFVLYMSDRLANPREHPLHRRSATNSTTQHPVRNIYRQVMNESLSTCIIQWYNLTHAYQLNRLNFSGFAESLAHPPPANQVIGAVHAHFCDPTEYNVPPNVRSPRRYLQRWTCYPARAGLPNGGDDAPMPPLRFLSPDNFEARVWNDPGRCKRAEPQFIYPDNQNATYALAWWKQVAQTAASMHLNNFEVARCSVQLTDPDADPHVSLFPDNFTESRLGPGDDPRLPSHFVRDTALNTVSCFIQVAVDAAAFTANLNADKVAALRKKADNVHCNPFKENCGKKNAAATAFVAIIVGAAVLVAIALGLLIACIVQTCKLSKTKKASRAQSPPLSPKKTQ